MENSWKTQAKELYRNKDEYNKAVTALATRTLGDIGLKKGKKGKSWSEFLPDVKGAAEWIEKNYGDVESDRTFHQ